MVDADKSVDVPKKNKFLQRRSVRVFLFLVLFVGVTLAVLPVGIRLYLEKWLQENGADSVTIERVRFMPFSGVVGLDGVKVVQGGQTVFADSSIYVNLGLRNLLKREAMLQQVTLEDIVLDIAKNEDGSLRIASFTLPAPGEKPKQDVIVEEVSAKAPWTLLANAIDLKNVKVSYKQPDLKLELVIQEAFVEKFNTDPDTEEGLLRLKGTVNGAKVDIDLPKLHVAPYVDVEGRVVVNGFQLKELADMLGQVLHPFDGAANLDAKVRFTMKDSTDIEVHYDGSLSLDDGDVGGESWATGGTFGYDGVASFTMKQQDMKVLVDGDLRAEKVTFDMPQPLLDIDNPNILISGKTVVTIGDGVLVDTEASLELEPTTYVADGFKTGAGNTSWNGKILVDTGTESRDLSVKVNGKMSVGTPFFNLEMEKGLMEVGNDLVSWDGDVEYILGRGEQKGSSVRTDGTLLGKETYYRLPDVIDISQHELELKGETKIGIGEIFDVAYSGDFHIDTIGIDMVGMSVAQEKIAWKGDIGYSLKNAEKSQLVALNGAMDIVGTDLSMSEIGLQVHQDSVSLLPEFELTLAEKPAFTGQAGFEAKGLEVSQKSVPMLHLEQVAVAGLKGDGTGGIIADSLDSEGLKILSSDSVPVGVEIPVLSLREVQSPDLMSGSATSFVVEKPQVMDKEGEALLVGLEAIELGNITVSKEMSASIDRIVLDGGRFIARGGAEPMAKLGQLVAEKLEYSKEDGLVCDSITADSLTADILREKKEEGEKPVEETKAGEEVVQAEEDQAQDAVGIPVKINRFDLTGQSSVRFSDTTLARTFISNFDVDTLSARDIDLNKPEQPFSYVLKGRFDKYTPLEVTGECAPLAKEFAIRQKVTLRNYSMLHISPYVVEAIGAFFPSGVLDFHSTLEIAEGNIDMKNNLVLKDLVTEGVKGELASELDNQLPVPLNLALAMLEDSEGVVDLDVPIQGKLSEVSIGTADLIWTPISKAISIAVTPYLAYTALGPAGAMYYLGAKIGTGLLKTNLPVLEFEKGERELTEKHVKQLQKAAKIIAKDLEKNGDSDPEYGYSICAKVALTELASVSSDREENQEILRNEAIRKELFKLGEARSLVVKEYLVENFAIDESRLMICNPGLNFDEDANPLVEFKK
ncbi:DUF748 domain-containing protein [Desulfopila sp. IMCC35008]|uniref:DUF748 domain-containing protein n=1 Tax=Desulfopila sp. IMCC35008 TaxID=2653858 RepID=UPI0013D6AE4F|nr:DUF748 domain-containing protein [Desulfopila sp. IMCC35008]